MVDLSVIEFIIIFILQIVGSFGFPGRSLGVVILASSMANFYSLILVILIVFIASSFGDILAYETAKFFSGKFRKRLRLFHFFKDKEKKARELLQKYEFSIVFLTRFLLIGFCATVSYVAGFEQINRKKFILAVLLGKFFYAVTYSFIGYFLGKAFYNVIRIVNHTLVELSILAVVVYLIIYFVRKLRKD